MTPVLGTILTFVLASAAPEGLTRLAAAYPGHIACYGENAIRFHDGTRMVYDPGTRFTEFEQRLNNASLKDQIDLSYPHGADATEPEHNHDPGRFRHLPFFKKIYGTSREAVLSGLTEIKWRPSGTNLRVTRINGVAEKLAAVSRDFMKLPADLRHFVDEPQGAFNWRVIAGTKRLSPHSFGIALDIDTEHADYWRWRGKDDDIGYRNRIPMEIVEIFERYGFIWGGRWYHYDTMHFEYRPELLPLPEGAQARACVD